MNREELEYHLTSDQPRYRANPMSRWDKPEFAAVFTDTVRKLAVLRSTRVFMDKHATSFAADMKIIAGTTDKDFEAFQANLTAAALQNMSLTQLISEAKHKGATAVQKTLQHMLMHTANAPMTEGYKLALRHVGASMNLRYGSFSAFSGWLRAMPCCVVLKRAVPWQIMPFQL